MATDAGELVVKITGDISDIKASLQQVAEKVQGLGATTVAAGNIIATGFERAAQAALDFVKQSVMAAADHEEAMTRLSIVVGKDVAGAMGEYADQLQKTTAFSDDAVLALENQLAQYGILPGSVKQATKALLDFAAVTGDDLPSAGQMLARAMAGQSRELRQFGLDLSTTATRTENLDKTIGFLEQRFGGAAETMRGTTLGAVHSLQNEFADLEKKVGQDLLPILNKLLSWAHEMLGPLSLIIRSHQQYADTIDGQKQKLADLVASMKAQVSNGVEVTASQKEQVQALIQHIHAMDTLTPKIDQQKGATDREATAVRNLKDEVQRLEQEQQNLAEITQLSITKRILAAQNEVQQLIADQKAVTQMTELETEKRLLTSQNSWEANASFSDQLKVKMADDIAHSTQDWVNMASQMLDSFSQATARMIVEGGRFSDVMKNLWRQLAEEVIAQIIRMIAEWIIFQGMTGGAGGFLHGFMADGGMINEPSIITGLRTGKKHLAGEMGPEMVVPTRGGGGGNVAFNEPGQSPVAAASAGGGGGGITINISGQFVDASPSKWNRMIQEQIVPQLRRFSMTQPNGVVNRKRGAMA